MKQYIVFMGVLLLSIPTGSATAYFTTAQHAYPLSDSAALFLIEYTFGDKDEDVYMPVFGVRDLPHNAMINQLGYEIVQDEDATTSEGTTAGIVLSSMPREGDLYRIPAGMAAKMTLVVLFATDEDSKEADYALHVQELPFYVGDEKAHRKLNPSELQYYVTPEVELNEEN